MMRKRVVRFERLPWPELTRLTQSNVANRTQSGLLRRHTTLRLCVASARQSMATNYTGSASRSAPRPSHTCSGELVAPEFGPYRSSPLRPSNNFLTSPFFGNKNYCFHSSCCARHARANFGNAPTATEQPDVLKSSRRNSKRCSESEAPSLTARLSQLLALDHLRR